jgi:hypothetical protein
MPRPQFTIRTLLWLTLVVGAFLGGIGFEKERRRREIAAWDAVLEEAMEEALRTGRSNGILVVGPATTL